VVGSNQPSVPRWNGWQPWSQQPFVRALDFDVSFAVCPTTTLLLDQHDIVPVIPEAW